jgi:hypothetical protein
LDGSRQIKLTQTTARTARTRRTKTARIERLVTGWYQLIRQLEVRWQCTPFLFRPTHISRTQVDCYGAMIGHGRYQSRFESWHEY